MTDTRTKQSEEEKLVEILGYLPTILDEDNSEEVPLISVGDLKNVAKWVRQEIEAARREERVIAKRVVIRLAYIWNFMSMPRGQMKWFNQMLAKYQITKDEMDEILMFNINEFKQLKQKYLKD
jgi:hypothetical protein